MTTLYTQHPPTSIQPVEMKDNSSVKGDAVDDVQPVEEYYQLPLPESCLEMSEADLKLLERKIVRKADLVIL
jgi:hypothetical protein